MGKSGSAMPSSNEFGEFGSSPLGCPCRERTVRRKKVAEMLFDEIVTPCKIFLEVCVLGQILHLQTKFCGPVV